MMFPLLSRTQMGYLRNKNTEEYRKNTLQVHSHSQRHSHIKCHRHSQRHIKCHSHNDEAVRGTFLSINKQASITIEMACILPFVIFIWFGFLSLWQIIVLQGNIQKELEQVVDKVAASSYAIEKIKDNFLDETDIALENNQIGKYLLSTFSVTVIGEMINQNVLENIKEIGMIKENQLSYGHSTVDFDKGEIDIVVTYDVVIPFIPLKTVHIPMVQRCYKKMWLGVNYEKKEEEIYVYVAKTGTVYHTTPTCSHLKLSITSITKEELEERKNQQGNQYSFCEICQRETNEEVEAGMVYITNTGQRYHNRLDCSGILRNVKKVPLSEVSYMGGCKRCAN